MWFVSKRLLLRILTASACSSFLFACDKEDDPSAVDVQNLKYPHSLSITDAGTGIITLKWFASNYEPDFEGYNIYGVRMSDKTLAEYSETGLEIGKPVELLDTQGNVRAEAKEILQLFNYDTSNPLEVAKEEEPSNGGERKISYLPIHNVDGDDDPVLPTCYPLESSELQGNASTTCEAYTEENVDSIKDEDEEELHANGSVSYSISGLTPGEQYCFLVFSVQDDGKEISQTSTNLACVRPSVEVEVTYDLSVITTTDGEKFDINAYSAACGTTCPDITTSSKSSYGDYFKYNVHATSTSDSGLYIEGYLSGKAVAIVPGKDCGILDLGVRSGLDDETLPNPLPNFDNAYVSGDDSTNVINSNGYSPAGSSTDLLEKHAYAVACEDPDDKDKVLYHKLFINQSSGPVVGNSTMTLVVRAGITSIAKK